jgi:hypothetical protein
MHSELKLDLSASGSADVSLHGSLARETLNERINMSIETKVRVGLSVSARIRVTLVMIIVGLLGLGAGPVSPLI